MVTTTFTNFGCEAFDQLRDLQSHKYNKKLSYCCDSRSYCMQYLNAIHCDRNISTSE